MKQNLRILMAQLNLHLGDISSNTDKIVDTANLARDEHQSDLIIFPELAITSYPPQDLLLRPECHRRVRSALERLKDEVQDIHMLVGHSYESDGRRYNAASLIFNGEILATYYKQYLPNYSVFDEKRYFTPGDQPCIVNIKGVECGIVICEDLWHEGPLQRCEYEDADLILCLNASPFHMNKISQRIDVIKQQKSSLPIVYTNLVGGQDELVFDGYSFALNNKNEVVALGPGFTEALVPVEFSDANICGDEIDVEQNHLAEIYQALVLGTRDYIQKNNFPGVLIGLSGGIDSALSLAIAVDALDAENVHAVMMPSEYTSTMSLHDAEEMASTLNVKYSNLPISKIQTSFLESLSNEFSGLAQDTTEENIQARIRGILLMALSNKTGKMVLTTGNKSEMAVGYATLYGDMAGGFNALKDVSKTLVYELSEYRNQVSPVIPQRIIDRPPSAELAPNQVDQDSLPPYNVLDPIIAEYVEENRSKEKVISMGYNQQDVEKVIKLIDRNEYKRRQAAPGVKISHRAFGRDWRYPITSAFGKDKS